MKRILVLILFPACAAAQNFPPFRLFGISPSLYNAAYTGITKNTTVSLFYRRQWINFNDAPQAGGFQLLTKPHPRIGFGFTFYSQEVVGLTDNSLQTTFSYSIPLRKNIAIHFALSGGVGHSNLNLDGTNYPDDPAILKAAGKNFYPQGNFGFLFVINQWQVGFALPRLFGQAHISPKDLNGNEWSQLLNQLYSLSYKFDGSVWAFKPYGLYRLNRDLQHYWEAGSILYYKDRIWIGSSYQHEQGPAFSFGGQSKRFSFNYSVEIPALTTAFYSTSSHEIILTLQFARRNSPSESR